MREVRDIRLNIMRLTQSTEGFAIPVSVPGLDVCLALMPSCPIGDVDLCGRTNRAVL